MVPVFGSAYRQVMRFKFDVRDLQVTVTVLNLVFSVLTAVAMFLCFFSLLASMMANINEQQKEVGVLLAVGLGCAELAS